jgi:hypothetical protein
VLGGFVVYELELRLGWGLFRNPAGMANEGYLDGLAFLMLGIYGIALARAWKLPGAVPNITHLGDVPALGPSSCPYSPECVEGRFSKVAPASVIMHTWLRCVTRRG